MLPTQVVLSHDARRVVVDLTSRAHEKRAASLLRSIERAIRLLEERPFFGDIVPRRLVPQQLQDAGTLFRVELPSFWRLLYTVKQEQECMYLVITVIHVLNHKDYDTLFGYKKV